MAASFKVSFLLFAAMLPLCSTSGDIGYFWHVTDFHWDPTYSRRSPALSCGPKATEGRDYGKFGDYLCDPPWQLINSSVHGMRHIKPDPDFLIWTGDDTPHIWNDTILNKEAVVSIVQNQTALLQDVFHDRLVFSAIGNHDWSPKNQLPPHPAPVYDIFADMWKKWFDNQSYPEETFRKGGYYTMRAPGSDLQVIVLNTNLYYTSNRLTPDMPDPANQLQWLDDLLTSTAQEGGKAILVAHVPPGMFEKHRSKYWFYPYYNDVFLNLLRKHSKTIGSTHLAHHHTDSFRIVYETDGSPVSSMLLGPAVSPWETTLPGVIGGAANNPSIRLIKYNRTTGAVLDVHQYYMKLEEANRNQQAHWELQYNASHYGLLDMGTQSLHSLAQRFLTEPDTFRRYLVYNGVSYNPNERCDNTCKAIHYCAITQCFYSEYEACVTRMTAPPSKATFTLGSVTAILVHTLLALLVSK